MSTLHEKIKSEKITLANNEISPFIFDLFSTFSDIKKMETIDSIYLNIGEPNLEIYVFYEKEDFDIEDKIIKYLTNWEEQYNYFPEIFIYPLNMIENKYLTLPESAKEI